jgi:hypothetical protein
MPPGQVQGITAPTPAIPPPVAILPAPPASATVLGSPVPLALLGAFVAILLAATVLTARRRA